VADNGDVLTRPKGPGRAEVGLALIVAVIGAGALLRILALAALPDFFGPGDPATYWSMAVGVLRAGVPRIDFLWNFAGAPASISHVESYYEPAYAYLLATPLALFGARPVVARAVAAACGVLAIILTYAFARRHGVRVALVAATVVAIEPWSIYYSGVLMKETLVSVVVILALESLRRILAAGRPAVRTGASAAIVVLAAAAFQYELLPIFALATAIAVAALRRDALPAFVVVTAVVSGAAAIAAWTWMGVPLSAKFGFFLGQSLWTPAAGSGGTELPARLWRFLPIGYVLGALILKWYVPVAALAWIGSRTPGLARVEVVLPACFTICFLYFHGVPHDLWERDFIPLLPAVAPLVALATCRHQAWTGTLVKGTRAIGALPRGAVALGLIAGAATGTAFARSCHVAGVFPARWMPWSLIGSTLLFAIPITLLLRHLSPLAETGRVRRLLPAAALGMVLAAFSQSLPWPAIFRNPQFPRYEEERAAREHACDLLRTVPGGAVMSGSPAEVQLYSGRPAVLLPNPRHPGAIDEVRRRYGVRYLLAAPGELGPRTVAATEMRSVARRLGYELFEFGASAAGGAEPPR
jgi:4-amino-4-deoxy-L-arabinose transferase-like glycosyltransferase